jgi:hypothetical protein
MAQTKRKRRNKHRGNAVGIVEARGRTSKPQPGAARSNGSRTSTTRGARPLKPPSWQSAATKAAVGAVILFIFFRFVGKGSTTGGAVGLAVVAMVLYTPIMYLTDKWVYKRKTGQAARR